MNFLLSLLLALSTSLLPAYAFTFNVSTPQQCSDLTVSWSGGTEPFHLVLVPTITVTSGRIYNISIPDGSNGKYTFQLQQPAGLQFLATMYDKDGWGSGGTTPVLSVGSSSDSSCLDTNLLYDFYFSTSPDANPSQCSTMSITWAANATRPVNLYGLIPSGSAFSLPISQSSSVTSYDWIVDIAAASQFLLLMADNGPYQTGGSTSLLTVQSGGTSCMNSTSPASATTSSTSTSASATASASGGVGGGSAGGSAGDTSNSSSGSSSSSKTGAIVGGTLGGVAFVVLLGLLLLCCIRRKARKRRDSAADPAIRSYGVESGAGTAGGMKEKKQRRGGPFDILSSGRGHQLSDESVLPSGDHSPDGGINGSAYEPSPFRYPSPPPAAHSSPNAHGLGAFGAGAGTAGVLAAAAGANEKRGGGGGGASQPNSPGLGMAHPAYIDSTRNSTDTGRTNSSVPGTGTGTGNGTGNGNGSVGTPLTTTNGRSSFPPSALHGHSSLGGAEDGQGTDVATLGHSASIRKAPSAGQLQGGGGSPRVGSGGVGGDGRPLPNVPQMQLGGETRFVQHEDAGEVVDLPPRYDQLRARNPDQAASS